MQIVGSHNMKSLITITFLFLAVLVYSQDKQIIYTDSSRIEIDTAIRGQKSIEEFIKGKNIVRWTFIKNDVIQKKAQFDTLEHCIGIWYEYDETGKLIRTEDYENRIWTVHNTKLYPYISLLDQMKSKADKIVINAYGVDFFRKHTKWDFGQSTIANRLQFQADE